MLGIFLRGCLLAFGLTALAAVSSCTPRDAGPALSSRAGAGETATPIVSLRRLTFEQYQNIVSDVFGSPVAVVGQFDPLVRTAGLLAVGAANATTTPAGFEQFEAAARSVATQVVSPANRGTLVPCTPQAGAASDDNCTRAYFASVGRLLFRRALTAEEIDMRVAIVRAAADNNGDYYAGIESGLSSLLMTPAFLFITEAADGRPSKVGVQRLDAPSKATRLSFLLWNTTPDDALLTASERGELNTAQGLKRQVDRLLDSPRLKRGTAAFFADMLAFEKFAVLEKDSTLYPAYSLEVANDAREQLIRTINDHLISRNADYRDLFTTRKTFLSSALARVYRVPAPVPGGWGAFEYPGDDPRAGIQTAFAFTALHSHPGRSSPTLRGKAIRELLLCQRVPDPPGNVDFSLFTAPSPTLKTARQRLDAHSTNPVCAGCHKLVDPIGLALENFDGAGQFRRTENGAAIDPSGRLDGVDYKTAGELGAALRANRAATSCIVNRLYAYTVGRAASPREREAIAAFEKRFEGAGYRFADLLRAIATDEMSYVISVDQ
ncbi:MAG: DUF1592 domain-containing protein [Rhodospirillaceae bacterium]|nr:DUF1592 domain-containing protein [Rhodospirillaceae bacterium]